MKLLERDNVKEEVNNYYIYSIADKDTPQLSADRLEYTLSNGLGAADKIWGLSEIMKKMIKKKLITLNDLYTLSEKEVIEKISNCKQDNIAKCFELWKNATVINESDTKVDNTYCVSIDKIKISTTE